MMVVEAHGVVLVAGTCKSISASKLATRTCTSV